MTVQADVPAMDVEALLDGLDEVGRVADVGGGALPLVLAAAARWDCTADLIDMTPDGAFAARPSPWIAGHTAALTAAGVPEERIRRVASVDDLRPADLVANLAGFGDRHKVRYLTPVLERALHADSRMVMDIRKGSGAFPFLKDFGTTRTLAEWTDDGKRVSRVVFAPKPPADPGTGGPSDSGWSEIAAGLAGPDGFFRENGQHSFLFMPRDRTLVVTFDNLDIAMHKRTDRRPWGFSFIEKQGWSMLGVMANGWTWYRDPWVWGEFDRLAAEGFFKGFDRVVFYGASMGGYAACAFVPACPGADVLAISPQSTLNKALVPWETRYSTAWGKDFSGRYGDAAQTLASAGRAMILYDPYETLDAGHVDRLTGGNVTKLRAPLMGHRLGSSLSQMGILTPVTLAALDGTLDEGDFYRLLRKRRDFPRYQRELFRKAVKRGRRGLARRVGDWVLARGDHRFIRLALKDL